MIRPGTSLYQVSCARHKVMQFLFCLLFILTLGGCATNQQAINRLETEERLRLLLLGPFEMDIGYGIGHREVRSTMEKSVRMVTNKFEIIPDEEMRATFSGKPGAASVFSQKYKNYFLLSESDYALARELGKEIDADFVAMVARNGQGKDWLVSLVDVKSPGKTFSEQGPRSPDFYESLRIYFSRVVTEAEQQMYQALFNKEVEKRIATTSPSPPAQVQPQPRPQTSSIQTDAPPSIFIRNPQNEIMIEAQTIDLDIVIISEDGLEKVQVLLNGKPAIEKGGRGIKIQSEEMSRDVQITRKLPAQFGQNQIRIVATSKNGATTEKEIEFTRVKSHGNIYSLVIGVNQYENVPTLNYAVDDARAFADFLIDHLGVPEENVTVLLDRDVTLKAMRSTMGGQLKRIATKDDTVIIYYAGHGSVEDDEMNADGDGLEKYLMPYNADPEELFGTALSMDDLNRAFSRIKSDRLIFIADACYSGAVGGRSIFSPRRATISENFMNRLSAGTGRIILAASGANQTAKEDPELGHGVFTYYLIEGLKGAADNDDDGFVTFDEAYAYVSTTVSKATGQTQTPVRRGEITGELYIGKAR